MASVIMAAVHFNSPARFQKTSARLHRVDPTSERPSSLGRRRVPLRPLRVVTERKPAAASKIATERKPLKAATTEKKPAICTADEVHYVDIPHSDWRLALWRYFPSPQLPKRKHPLLLLSGIGTNAIGFDLSPENSFARYMAGQGYDTWTLELRGVGLSTLKMEANGDSKESQITSHAKEMAFRFGQPPSFNFIDNFAHSPQEAGGSFSVATQMRELSRNLLKVIEGAEGSSLPLFGDISLRLKDAKKQLDEMVKYNWDFDNHLEEDLPAAMEYIKSQSKPKDGKLFAIGHSMGGILLYATLARCCFQGRDSGLASITTLGSSLDYTSSRSSLNMLLPLVHPARALDVPAIPTEALSTVIHPFGTHFSYAVTWLNTQIPTQKILNMFSTVPSNLLVQLGTTLQERGLCNRNGTIFYKDHLYKSKVPILALAGDQDDICPPEAVYETVKHIPENFITYKVFGDSRGPHYAHYDIVGGHLATDRVYPYIVEFLNGRDIY